LGRAEIMAKKQNKRFYKSVAVEAQDASFLVKLDGMTLKTPGKKTLLIPTRKAADLVAAEWEAQGEYILPLTMPVTRLLNVAVEQTPDNRDALIAEARNYAAPDVLCYREGTVRLHQEHQAKMWDPILAWAAEQGVVLKTTETLSAVTQAERSLDKVADYARALDDMRLTLFVHFTAVFGSAVLAMAVMENHLSGSDAYDLSRLDELWQIKYWGEDEIAKERTDAISEEVVALCKLIK